MGIALVPVLIPVETWVAKKSQAYRKTVLKVADARYLHARQQCQDQSALHTNLSTQED